MSSQQLRISSDLYDKTVKASHSLTNTVKSYANDSSIGLYRVQEHIHKRTPTAVRERLRNCLVIGGSGFLGQHLVNALLAKGSRVTILDIREPRGMPQHVFDSEKLQVVTGDLSNFNLLQHTMTGHSSVFHVASPPYHLNDRQLFERVNVEGTKLVIKACQQSGVKRLILTSSCSVVYDGKDMKNADEETPFPATYLDCYTHTKMKQENLVIEANSDTLQTIAIRPHGIFGPNDYTVTEIANKSLEGKMKFMIGNGSNIVDFTHVSNVVHGHILAAEALDENSQCSGQVYNITNDEPVHFWIFTKIVLTQLGLEAPSNKLPFSTIYAIAVILQVLSLLLLVLSFGMVRWTPFLTPFKVALAGTHHYYNCEKAKRDLGYRPVVSLEQGIKETVEYLRPRLLLKQVK
ncbi:hypothetical protein MP228_012144 [Amoeboaphelidium protococcarum]|nr:hypothetical protein MP228_012144 [Amoeboaphelidium protococcarum]